MRRRVDAAGETGDDHLLDPAELARELARESTGRGGGIAGADHRDAIALRQVRLPLDDDHRRGAVDLAEEARIILLVHEDVAGAEPGDRVHLGFRRLG